jgi:hypothetical protein
VGFATKDDRACEGQQQFSKQSQNCESTGSHSWETENMVMGLLKTKNDCWQRPAAIYSKLKCRDLARLVGD